MSRGSGWAAGLLGAAWAGLTLLLALGGSAAEPDAPWPEPLAVEWGHCAARAHGAAPVCVYDPAEPVRLWIDHPRAEAARVRIDGQDALVEAYALAVEPGGQGLRVRVPPGAHELEVAIEQPEGVHAWGLLLRQRPAEPPRQRPEPSAGPSPEEALAAALGSDDADRIERVARRVADGRVADGHGEHAALTLCAASFRLRQLRAFEAAGRMLDRAAAIEGASSTSRIAVSIYRGVLLWSQGDLHQAVPHLRDGTRSSLRIENAMLLPDALPIYAEALAELGYYPEARYWARQVLEHLAADACNQARNVRTAGWINLVLRAREQPHDDPRPLLERAIALYRTQPGCAAEQGAAQLSLALLAFGDGDADGAAARLDAIDGATLSVEDRVRAADLRVRLRLAAADVAGAEQAWAELQTAAAVVDDDDARWRQEVRRGEILARRRDHDAALEAFSRAEQRLDRLVRAQAVVGVGRTATADRYLEGTTAWVSLLVALGRAPEALCVARQARARRRSAAAGLDVLPPAERAAVEDRRRRYRELKRRAEQLEASIADHPQAQEPALRHEAQQLAREASALVDEIVASLMQATASPRCEQLVPAAPGELLLGLYPREHDWLVFVQHEGATRMHGVAVPGTAELADPAALGKRLLAPIGEALDRAARVRVLAYRETQALDVHLLPWRGRPLLARVPVTYGVELPALPPVQPTEPPRALLLADPTGTLLAARAEIDDVAARLRDAGWQVDAPATDDRAASEPTLAGYALLHYAAHTATHHGEPRVWAPYPAGEAGGLPHLRIGPTARLEVHDIVAQRPMPPVAFLAGCKTGLVELDAGSTSLALAFLLADGRQVVASREDVADALAADVARRFYARLQGEHGMDAAAAMHRVQQELLRDGGGVVPYRVWVR